MNNKIYIVSEYVDAIQNSTGYYWSKIISALNSDDKVIHVISSEKSCQIASKDFNREFVKFFPIKDKTSNNINFFNRALNDIFFSLRLAFAVNKKIKKNDTIVSGTNPAFLFLFLAFIKIYKKFKLVVIVHDIFPENLVPSGSINRNYSFVLKPIIFLFNLAYSNLTSIVVIGRDMKQTLLKKIYSKKVNIEYIPNFIDFNDIKNSPLKNINNSRLTFNFFGNLGPLQGIDNLLEAIRILNNTSIKFNFIGTGSKEDLIKKFMKNNPSIDMELHNNLPFNEKNKMLYDGDIAIVSLSKGMRGLAVPSKTYFSLAANKPILVIADKGSELDYLISENKGIGWFCVAGEPKKLAQQIRKIYTEGQLLGSDKPIRVVKRSYDYSNIKDKYKNLINKI